MAVRLMNVPKFAIFIKFQFIPGTVNLVTILKVPQAET